MSHISDNAKINSAHISGVFSNKDYLGFVVSWSAIDVGFGEACVRRFHSDGRIEIDSEYMGKEFVKKVLDFIVDSAKMEYEK